MKYGYRRITLYQKKLSVIVFIVMLAIASMAIEIFFIEYMISHGLENRIQWITISNLKLGIPILYLPIIGIVAVLLSTWAYIVERPYMEKRGPGKWRASSHVFRMFNSSIFLLLVLCIFLFLPCILSSNWSLKKLFLTSNKVPSLRMLLLAFYKLFFYFMDMPIIWKFTLLQSSACLALAIFSFFVGVKTNRRTLERRL